VTHFDSTHVDWSNGKGNEDEESDAVEDLKDEEYGAGEFTLKLTVLAEKYDLTDQDWVPAKYHRERQVKKGELQEGHQLKNSHTGEVSGHCASYVKGPGITNKSLCTQQQRVAEWTTKSSLKLWFGKGTGTNIQYVLDMIQDN